MNKWEECRNILIVRSDNLGDLLMSSPAIRAVKQQFKCRITLLTSEIAAQAAVLLPEIDEVITADFPWVKKEAKINPGQMQELANTLKERSFDGCIIFTVYSQSALPAALLVWMADIPLRLGYCRENPYDLLNYWIPEKEPYLLIRHQVERDLFLVKSIGATGKSDEIKLNIPKETHSSMEEKLQSEGINIHQDFLIFHAGVSEEKRKYAADKWIALAQEIIHIYNIPILFTGSQKEKELTDELQAKTGKNSFSLGGLLTVPEFAALISEAKILVSVNTAAIHLAAGLQTPTVVLYAQTNPQHKPWKVDSQIFEYSVPEGLESKNEIVKYVNKLIYIKRIPEPDVLDVSIAVIKILAKTKAVGMKEQ